jgi:hypothetical protein
MAETMLLTWDDCWVLNRFDVLYSAKYVFRSAVLPLNFPIDLNSFLAPLMLSFQGLQYEVYED